MKKMVITIKENEGERKCRKVSKKDWLQSCQQ